ncbi:MAG TPA: glycoside hydrolase family 15 protein [Terracidiphilus sp.]|nr:glycoside hydrolase family 15 protein [Terracidiphilus sp.]
MKNLHCVVLCLGIVIPAFFQAGATNLVTGNGFGFTVVTPQNAAVTKFYAHPYSFAKPDAQNPLSEGIATTNFIKTLTWETGGATAEYENDSHVIHARGNTGEGFIFMPFRLHRAALILMWEPATAAANRGFNVEWNARIEGHEMAGGEGVELVRFEAIAEKLLLIPLSARSTKLEDQQLLSGSQAWALVSIGDDGQAETALREFSEWRAGLAPRALVKREIDELEQWRVTPGVRFADEKARHLWRQSEVMLRMAQCREPNRADFHGNGLIVASMPDGVWFTPWVRDMAWATVALAKMGHREEARAAVLAYFNAQPTGKMRAATAAANYQISVVRYFGDGEEEPFFTEEGSTNIEYDDWGEALWVLGEYMRKYGDDSLLKTKTYRGELYESARDFIVKPLEANMEPYGGGLIVKADTSIWEERQKDKKHFAFSTAMAIVGLEEFGRIAAKVGDQGASSDARRFVGELHRGFDAAFIRNGKLRGTLEEGVKNDIDGALLAIVHFGVVSDPTVIRNTLQRMELLKVDSGGYRRVRSTYNDPKIFEYWYERQEFLFVDFSLAEVDRKLARMNEASAIVKRIVDKAAADHNIIPEMYVALNCKLFQGNLGDPTGARPMVGYGAGEYILDVLDSQQTR